MTVEEKARRRWRIVKTILTSMIAGTILVVTGLSMYIYTVYDMMVEESYSQVEEVSVEVKDYASEENIIQNSEVRNILLIGTDQRGTEACRSDAMIICSIDSQNDKIKLTSLMRDSYVDIPGRGLDKLNHAFAYGGADLLMQTLKNNFDIDVKEYVIINFEGFVAAIDLIDGIEMEISEEERNELNNILYGDISERGFRSGENIEEVIEAGNQSITGHQALAYSRIRGVGNGDYERTDRQRDVIDKMLKKIKVLPMYQYPALLTEMTAYIKTNIPLKNSTALIYSIFKLDFNNIEQLRFPPNEIITDLVTDEGMWVLETDKNEAIDILHDFIYEKE